MNPLFRSLVLAAALVAAVPAVAAESPAFPNRVLQLAKPGGPGVMVALGDDDELRPSGAFTIEAWVRIGIDQPLSPWPIILSKPAGNLLNGDCSYGLILERATGRVSFRVTTSNGTFNATSPGSLMDGKWHHLAGLRTVDAGGFVHLSVDGTVVASTVITGTTLYAPVPLFAGGVAFTGYAGNYFTGEIDELRFWNVSHAGAELWQQRGRVLDRAPGLVAAWHFDGLYPDAGAQPSLLDSARRRMASSSGLEFPATPPSATRGFGLTVADVWGQKPGAGARHYDAAVRLAGGFDLVSRRLVGPNQTEGTELTVVAVGDAPRPRGSLFLPTLDPITQMVARDSIAWCVRGIEQSGGFPIYRLFAVRITPAGVPEVFGDSLDLLANVRLVFDPSTPTLLVAAGRDPSGTENWLTVIDVADPSHPVKLVEEFVGNVGDVGQLVDVAKRGFYVYGSFSAGTLRTWRYTVSTIGGVTVRSLSPVGTPIAAGEAFKLAASGTRLYAASGNGTIRVYDLSSPTTPVLAGSATDALVLADQVRADGNRFLVTGGNGVHYFDATNPANPIMMGQWCADLPASSYPAATLGGNWIGLVADLAGYTVLRIENTTGVAGTPEPRAELRLVAGPNPSHGRVSFDLPRALGDDSALEIFDTAGRRVRSGRGLASARAGRWTWDGRDESGAPVPAGLYLARLVDAAGAVHRARVAIVK